MGCVDDDGSGSWTQRSANGVDAQIEGRGLKPNVNRRGAAREDHSLVKNPGGLKKTTSSPGSTTACNASTTAPEAPRVRNTSAAAKSTPRSAASEAAAAWRTGSCIGQLANQSVEAGTLHRCSADETGQRRLLRIARHEVGGHRLPALHRWLPHRRPERTQGTLRRFDMPGDDHGYLRLRAWVPP